MNCPHKLYWSTNLFACSCLYDNNCHLHLLLRLFYHFKVVRDSTQLRLQYHTCTIICYLMIVRAQHIMPIFLVPNTMSQCSALYSKEMLKTLAGHWSCSEQRFEYRGSNLRKLIPRHLYYFHYWQWVADWISPCYLFAPALSTSVIPFPQWKSTSSNYKISTGPTCTSRNVKVY